MPDSAQTIAIALIGPSGSGKSSIGKSIADKLGWEFIDTDREIERRAGMTVARIFCEKGESEFRCQESLLLEELSKRSHQGLVLATGGGMPIFADNLTLLQSMAVLVYLNAPLEVLVTRVNRGEERPLLAGEAAAGRINMEEQTRSRLGNLIAQRASIYNRARYKIDTSTADVEQLAADIIKLVGLVI